MRRYPTHPSEASSAGRTQYLPHPIIERLYELGVELDKLSEEHGISARSVTHLDRDWTIQTLRDTLQAPQPYLNRFVEAIWVLQGHEYKDLETLRDEMIRLDLTETTGYELLQNELRRQRHALGFKRWRYPE